MLRGTPGRYSSAKPCRRFWTNLERHLPTVGLEHLSSAATTSFVFPSAQANTIFDLKARACGLFGRRAQRERVSLSSSDSTRGAFGRPRSAMRTSIVAHGERAPRFRNSRLPHISHESQNQETSPDQQRYPGVNTGRKLTPFHRSKTDPPSRVTD